MDLYDINLVQKIRYDDDPIETVKDFKINVNKLKSYWSYITFFQTINKNENRF